MRGADGRSRRERRGLRRWASLAVFGLLATAVGVVAPPTGVAQAQTVPAPIVVPENWALKPSAVGPGGQFRLMFMTSTKRDATATDIATYDTFVQNRATNHGHAAIRQYGAQFKVVGSTATVDARDHTMTNPSNSAHPTAPIYWLNGPRVVDNNNELWSNQWDNWKQGDRKTEAGSTADNDWHWTGTNVNGTKHTNHLGSSGNVRRGRFWINSGTTGPISHTDTSRSESHSFYALSPVFQVAGTARALPAPSSYRFPSFSSVYEGERKTVVFEKVEGSSVAITVSTTAPLNEFNLYYPHGSTNPIAATDFTSVLTDGTFTSTTSFSASVSNGLVKFAVQGLAGTGARVDQRLEVTLTGPGRLPARSTISLPAGERPKENLVFRTKQGSTPEWVEGDRPLITLEEGGGVVEYQYKFHRDPYEGLYNPQAVILKEMNVTPIVDPQGRSKQGGNRAFFHLEPAADFDRISCVATPDHGVSWRKGKQADEINGRVDNETGPHGFPYKSALHKHGLDADGNTVDHDMHGGCDHKRKTFGESGWDQWSSVKFQAGHDADAFDHHFDIVHSVARHADSSVLLDWPVRVHIVDDDEWEQELVFSATENGVYTLGSEDGLHKALPDRLAPGSSHTFYIKLAMDPATLDRNESISLRVNPVDDPDDNTDDATYHPTYQEMETFVRVLGTTVLDNPSPSDYGTGHDEYDFKIAVSPTFKQPGASYIYADPGRLLTGSQRSQGRTGWDEPVEVTIKVPNTAPADGAVRIRVDTTHMLQRKDTDLPGDGHYYRTAEYEFQDWVVVPFGTGTRVGLMSEQYTPPAIDAQINKIAIGQLSDTEVKVTWGEMFGDQHYQVQLESQGGGQHSEEAGAPVHVLEGLEPDTEHTVQVFYVHDGEVLPDSGSEELTFTTLSPGSDPVTPSNPIVDLSAAGTSITEGETAVFTVTVKPPPPEPLEVEVDVSRSYNSGRTEIGLAGQLGRRTVVVGTSGSAQIEIATTDNDDTNKDNGVILAEIVDGDGYQKAKFGGAAQMAVLNDDAPPPNPVQLTRVTGDSVTAVWEAQPGVGMYEIVMLAEGSHDVLTKHTSGTTIEFTGLRSRTMYELRVWDMEYTPIGEKIRFRTLHPGEVWEAGDDEPEDGDAADDPPVVVPQVSITAGSGVTEGGTAQFTVSAVPAPSSPLTVDVSVNAVGDFGASAGSQTVTVPIGGSASFDVATTDDSADEPDGSLTASLVAGDGYTVSASAASATVSVADNDDPPPVVVPEVNIMGASGGTEGTAASFTVTASPAPSAPLAVSVTVAAVGDYGAATGARTVTIPVSGSATVSVDTSDDSTDEPDGSVTLTLDAGDGYTVGALGSETVQVLDDDDPAPEELNVPRTMTCSPEAIPEGQTGHLDCEVTDAAWGRVQIKWSDRSLAASYGVAIEGIPAGTERASSPCFRGDVDTGKFRLTYSSVGDGVETPNLGEIGFKWQPVDPAEGDRCQWITKPTDLGSVAIADDHNTQPVLVQPDPVVVPDPVVSITADGGITEGGTATFTVTANPAPSAALAVSISVSQSGDWGAATGQRTVTIPTTGTVTVSIATDDDSVDEPDGSVSAAVDAGAGYTVSASQGSAAVAVADDDDPPVIVQADPVVSITAGSGVTEGGTATFTVTANPAPSAPLTANVTVSQTGDFGAATGTRTVTIPASGSVTLSVATTDDSADEPDGSVSAAVDAGVGYTVSAGQGSATVAVGDDDAAPPPPVVDGPLKVSVADASATEGGDLEFAITLSRASDTAVGVAYITVGSRQTTAGSDFEFATELITFAPGETHKWVRVAAIDDNEVEGDETMTMRLVWIDGAAYGQKYAVGTIIDND